MKNFIMLSLAAVFSVAVIAFLVNIQNKIGRIEQTVSNHSKKVDALYYFVDSELGGGLDKYVEDYLEDDQDEVSPLLDEVFRYESSGITSMAKFHPSENIFAVLSGEGSLLLFDVDSKSKIKDLRIPDKIADSFAFMYDGETILMGMNNGELYEIKIATGEYSLIENFGDKVIAILDVGKNGNVAVGLAEDNGGLVYSLTSRKVLFDYPAYIRGDFKDFSLSSAGDRFAASEVKEKIRGACLFEASSGEEIRLFYHNNYGCGPLSVDLASDNKSIAVGYAPYHVIVWNTEDGSVKWLFEQHTNWVVSLDFNDDMRYLASGAGDSTARVYCLLSGQGVGYVRFQGSSTYIYSVDISSDNKYLLAATKGLVGIYQMPNEK